MTLHADYCSAPSCSACFISGTPGVDKLGAASYQGTQRVTVFSTSDDGRSGRSYGTGRLSADGPYVPRARHRGWIAQVLSTSEGAA